MPGERENPSTAERADAGEDIGVVGGFARIGLGTLVSRLSGFAREVVTAAFFGAGTSMDIFVAAFTIPNLLCRILGEATVESAFMPLFKGIHARGETARAWRLASFAANNLAVVLVLVVAVGIAAAPWLVSIVAHGFSGEVADSAARMTRLMFPFGLLIGLAALMGAILLSFRRFRLYSLAPIALNVGIIASVLVLSGRLSYVSLGVGVLLGGLMQFLVQLPAVSRLASRDGERLMRRGLGLKDPDVRRVAALSGPVVVAAAVQRVGVIVDRTIASFLVPGSISSLYYSFRLVHLPYAILALAAGRAVAPVLAEHYALERHHEFKETLLSGLRMNLAFLVPTTILAVWFASPVVGIVYQRGAFDETDLAMTASAFALYSVGLVGMGAVFLFVRAFAARLDTKTPVKISVVAFFLNVVLNLILVRTPLRHAGLALASSIAFGVHAIVLYVILNRRADAHGAAIRPRELVDAAVRVLVASGALVLVLWGLDGWLGIRLAENLLASRILCIAAAGGAGVLAYAAVARALGISEVTQILVRRPR